MANLLRDAQFGFRLLKRRPGFATVAVLALALGIGANTAIFSVIYSTLLEPMPYPDPGKIVVVWSKIQGNRNGVSAGDYLDWKNQSHSFEGLTAWTGQSFNLSTSSQPEQVDGRLVSPGFFSVTFGTPPMMGRDFLPEDGEVGKDHVLLITHALWQRRFGGDPKILGQQVRVNGESYTVVGVLPPGAYDRLDEQIFAPLSFKPEQLNHDFHWLLVAGRLKPGVTIGQAQADMNIVTQHIAEAYPKSNKSWSSSVEPLQNDFFGRDAQNELWLMMGAVVFVLLVACANVANLLLARGMARQKEIAVRASSGASRGELFSQFLTESLTLAAVGGVLGVALAWAMLKALMATMPPYTLPSEADVRVSLPVLGFTIAATMLSGVLFGVAPAWHASSLNLNEVLKEGGRSTSGSSRNKLRRALVVIEFSLALTLLTGAGLAIHTFWNLRQVDLGIRKDHVLTFSLPVPNGKLTQPEQINGFYKQLIDKIEALPGVESASASTGLPLEGTNFGMPFTIAGKPVADNSSRPGAGFQMTTPGYYSTYGIQMVKGRAFTEQDTAGGAHVAMVNENFVKKFLGDADPLTERILVEQLIPGVTKLGPPIEWQIIGVFHNVKNGNLRNGNFAEIDVPFWQSPWPQAAISVRTFNDPAGMSKSLAAVVQSMDSDLPISDVRTMDEILERDLSGDRFATTLLGTFAAVALILAAMGIYGVMAFAVAQRTHEIGLRMALGAVPSRVLGLIVKEGMLLTGIGLALGLAGSYLVGRAMKAELYGIGSIDPLVFGAVAAVLVASALLACYVPARRAMRVDPMVALRYE
ncbi:MAG TPA: ABC transporter permease [Candidatus Acidoferrum sp.]|jgi:putative ABC transport system permease protein|nr:ABC transporter permease [Candidatus Acidoferrum sp.]